MWPATHIVAGHMGQVELKRVPGLTGRSEPALARRYHAQPHTGVTVHDTGVQVP